jgi:adenosine deaminase
MGTSSTTVVSGAPDAAWIRGLPKAEVHLHLEGCIPLRTVGLAPQGSDRESGSPRFAGLADFLVLLDRCCALVTQEHQVESIAYGITSRAHASGVRHVDVIFNPTHWPAWRRRLGEFVARLDSGLAAGEADHGVTSRLCLSLKRTQPPSESVELLDWLLETRPERIAALSVDGNEKEAGPTGERFAPLFARARDAGLHTCAHAGESSGPQGVRDAVELLGVERIDHGVRAIEDPQVVAELVERAVPLDVCPTSNVILGIVSSIEMHPIDALRSAGVAVSINTDDPLLFGTSVDEEYRTCAAAFSWDRGILAQVARTSIDASFATLDRRRELSSLLEEYTKTPSAPCDGVTPGDLPQSGAG